MSGIHLKKKNTALISRRKSLLLSLLIFDFPPQLSPLYFFPPLCIQNKKAEKNLCNKLCWLLAHMHLAHPQQLIIKRELSNSYNEQKKLILIIHPDVWKERNTLAAGNAFPERFWTVYRQFIFSSISWNQHYIRLLHDFSYMCNNVQKRSWREPCKS